MNTIMETASEINVPIIPDTDTNVWTELGHIVTRVAAAYTFIALAFFVVGHIVSKASK